MRNLLVTTTALIILSVSLTSCYKTGEIIPQPICKPTEIVDTLTIYGRFGVTNYMNSIFYDATMSKVTTIRKKNNTSQLPVYFDFEYDNNNNLVKISEVEFTINGTKRTYWYQTFTYPTGTVGSYSNYAYQQFYYLNSQGTYDYSSTLLLEFNSEYQLTRVSSNNETRETYEYDFGGNLSKHTRYQSGQIYDQWTFQSFDNQICPFRADRSLQLFFKIFTKNNPTAAIVTSYTLPQGIPNTQQYLSSYTYNTNGYPVSNNGNYFANYNCSGTNSSN